MKSGQSILTMEYILRTNIRQATKPMVPAEEEGCTLHDVGCGDCSPVSIQKRKTMMNV